MLAKVLEQLGDCLAEGGGVRCRDAGRAFEPRAHFGLGEMEHEIVRSQARHIDVRVEAGERVVELVGEEHGAKLALLEHRFGPMRPGHHVGGVLVDRFPVVDGEPLAVEAEELAEHLDEPTVLDRVFERAEMLDQSPHLFPRRKFRFFDRLAGESGGMG